MALFHGVGIPRGFKSGRGFSPDGGGTIFLQTHLKNFRPPFTTGPQFIRKTSATYWTPMPTGAEGAGAGVYDVSCSLIADATVPSSGLLELNTAIDLAAEAVVASFGGLIVEEVITLTANGAVSALFQVELNEGLTLIVDAQIGLASEGIFEALVSLTSDASTAPLEVATFESQLSLLADGIIVLTGELSGTIFNEQLSLIADVNTTIVAGLNITEILELVVGGTIPGSGGTIFLRRR